MLDSVRAERRRLATLALLALLALAGTLALALWAGGSAAAAPGHVLVIDAGSSGTRMYAYGWRAAGGGGGAPRLDAVPSTAAPHKVPRRALPDKRAYQRVETEPGLDAFADDPAGLRAKALGGCCGRRRGAARAMHCCCAASCTAGGHPAVPSPHTAAHSPTCRLRCAGPLLEWAEAVVPRAQWDRTPVFLFGTAGLRKLRCGFRGDECSACARCCMLGGA